jgi:hypothetical protein
MNTQLNEAKLIKIFSECDDYCRLLVAWINENLPGVLKPINGGLCLSEIMTILISYHLSGYKNFEYFYRDWVLKLHNTKATFK